MSDCLTAMKRIIQSNVLLFR